MTGGGADAGSGPDAMTGPVVTGRVCKIDDIRAPGGACDPVANVTVQKGEVGATAMTDATGAFTLPAFTTTGPKVLSVRDSALSPTSVVIDTAADGSASGVTLWVVDLVLWQSIVTANSLTEDPTLGFVAVVVQDGAGFAQGALLGDMAGVAPLYDEGDPQSFGVTGPLDAFGFALYPGVLPDDDLRAPFGVLYGGEQKDFVADAVNDRLTFNVVSF